MYNLAMMTQVDEMVDSLGLVGLTLAVNICQFKLIS